MPGALTDTPFVLLDDARSTGAAPARLYRKPEAIIAAHSPEQVRPALALLAEEQADGLNAAGFLSYEAGHALEPRLTGLAQESGLPLLWFGLFGEFQEMAAGDVPGLLPDPAGGWAGPPRPLLSRQAYDRAIGRVKAYIEAGDIYQANLTFGCTVPTAGHPLAVYAGLRARAGAGYGGVVWTGEDWLLSFSPELFFAKRDKRITTKPMKGTATRGEDDAAIIDALRSDPKQRAENLMIVDLLRNDLSRVSATGSVEVPQLFTVETYPTVHQMTSTVTARLREGLGAAAVIEAIFPCGSITGAPKIRAMEVIGEVETGARGIYTGSIGRIDAKGDAAFNVAIRTLHLKAGETIARLGLGSGIVADSKPHDEWDECLAKGRFVGDPREFDLIETMRFDPAGGIHLLDRHIARIGASARAFGISFDRHAVRNELQAATFRIAAPRKVRLLLSQSGRIAIEIGRLPPVPDAPVLVEAIKRTADPTDFRLAHKTSDRSLYARPKDCLGFEVIYVDHAGFVSEGSFTNVFVKGDGVLLTPPMARGVLGGVLRGELIDNGTASEADLRLDDLKRGFFIGNAVRGLMEARLASPLAHDRDAL